MRSSCPCVATAMTGLSIRSANSRATLFAPITVSTTRSRSRPCDDLLHSCSTRAAPRLHRAGVSLRGGAAALQQRGRPSDSRRCLRSRRAVRHCALREGTGAGSGREAVPGPYPRLAGTVGSRRRLTEKGDPSMALVQIIEFRTSDIDRARQVNDEWWRATESKRTVRRHHL